MSATTDDTTPERGPRPSSWPRIDAGLHQGEMWQPRTGPPVRIVDMDPAWRLNTMRFLERRALAIARREMMQLPGDLSDASDGVFNALSGEMSRMEGDPVGWIKDTTLYRALAEGLPTKPKKLAKLAEKASHFSTCLRRKNLDAPRCTCVEVLSHGWFGNGLDGAEL